MDREEGEERGTVKESRETWRMGQAGSKGSRQRWHGRIELSHKGFRMSCWV